MTELRDMRQEVVVAHFKILIRKLAVGTEENHEERQSAK
jgi:hypothetical protein